MTTCPSSQFEQSGCENRTSSCAPDFSSTPHNIFRILFHLLALLFFSLPCTVAAQAAGRETLQDVCVRLQPGSTVPEPPDLRSHDGVLRATLTVHNFAESDGSARYCYTDEHGHLSPNLRVSPGDLVILKLKNDIKASVGDASNTGGTPSTPAKMKMPSPEGTCAGGAMSKASANLHFHGFTIPPVCHQDDVLRTVVDPGETFEYRFRVPENQPPGLYWYHPHVHGFTKVQVLGGASGALIVEGIERVNKAVAGLPERVLVIRDQDLVNPNAPPSKSEPVLPKMLIDRDGDATNTGTGFGKPAKDLSINYVPVPYPDYPPATIAMKPGEKQLWRVLNASAITYLNLAVIFGRVPQQIGIVAIDGAALNSNGGADQMVSWQTHIGVPPGSRVEFIVQGPPMGVRGLFVTRTVDTGPGGENDPNRALAVIASAADAPEPVSILQSSPRPLPRSRLQWLGDVAPVRVRKLYFSEKLTDPSDPTSATEFYITVDGQTPKPFDPNSGVPDIVAKQGDVEDWIIENRSAELHAFHIHQTHFMLLDYMGIAVNEPFLRDTVNVPYFRDNMLTYPSVRIRMDFRDPNTVGTFVYHCHLLEHEDNGMMGLIRVEPAVDAKAPPPKTRRTTVSKLRRPMCGLPPRSVGN